MRFFLLFLVSFAMACTNNEQTKTPAADSANTTTSESKNTQKIDAALTFINAYVANCNKMKDAQGVVDWVHANNGATGNLKTALKKTMDDAHQADPEMGLGADPIFDAQDYPDQGFELDSIDDSGNYIIVKGKNWPTFKLTIKLKEEHGAWLIDGVGMINVPMEKRMGR